MLGDRQRLRLEHIVENAQRIAGYTADLTFENFAKDQRTIDAVERCLSRITEAAIRLGEETMASVAPEIPRTSTVASATPCGMTTIRSTRTPSGKLRQTMCRCWLRLVRGC